MAQAQLLWRAVPPGDAPPLYLFGTMHLSAGKFLESNPYIQNAIKNSDVIFTETSLDDPNIASLFSKYIFMPEGVTLSDSLSATELSKLDSVLRSYGNLMISARSLDRCKPMYLMLLLESPLAGNSDSSLERVKENSVDFSVVKYATENKKNLRYFETPEQQLQYLFNDPPLDLQFRLLKGALAQIGKTDSMRELVLRLPEYYKKQNLDTIGLIIDYVNLGGKDMQELFRGLVTERNTRWISTIEHFESIGRHRAFVAVGAGHLVGDKGLIALLRNKGYTVTPVLPE